MYIVHVMYNVHCVYTGNCENNTIMITLLMWQINVFSETPNKAT